METALLSLFSLVFFVFAFGIALAVMGFRAVVEAIAIRLKPVIPDKVEDMIFDFWNEWVLPSAPVIFGGLLAFLITDYPYPAEFASTASARVFFGLVAGFFSGGVYRFAKFHLRKYLPEEIKNKIDNVAKKLNSLPPPSNTEE